MTPLARLVAKWRGQSNLEYAQFQLMHQRRMEPDFRVREQCADELSEVATAIESDHAALVAERDALERALSTIVANARLEADSQMQGATDCYAVPLEDIDVARYLTENRP